MSRRMAMVFWGVLLSALAACRGSAPPLPDRAAAAVMRTPAPPVEEYRIQEGDELDVKFFYHPDLNERLTVRPDGRISLQLIPEVTAAGKTSFELTGELEKHYSGELRDPEVAVIVRTFSSQRVFMDGELNQPGMVTLVQPTTLLDAIAQAGGLKESARSGEVIIIRRDGEGGRSVITADLDRILRGDRNHPDIYLQPFDTVYVPRSNIANVNLWVDQYIRRNIPLPLYIPLE